MFTKKITAMLAGVLCFCIQGFAQMMPDSTIQIVAYWQAGDKYSFKCKETKYQVDEKNDTTVLEARSEVRTFEIISQMKDRYHISLTYSDFYSSDEDEMKLDKAMNEVVGDYSIEFETNEFGILERFTNLQEVAVKMEPAVDYVVDNMYAENKDLKKMMPKRKMRSYMIAQTCTRRLYRQLFWMILADFSFSTVQDSTPFPPTQWKRNSLRYSRRETLSNVRPIYGLTRNIRMITV